MTSVETSSGVELKTSLLTEYFRNLVNSFFKILPMRENNEGSLDTYMRSLQVELLGCESLIPEFKMNYLYISLLSILQYLIDNQDCPIGVVKREIFRAISICNKLKSLYLCME